MKQIDHEFGTLRNEMNRKFTVKDQNFGVTISGSLFFNIDTNKTDGGLFISGYWVGITSRVESWIREINETD